ncbi:hypothetical protein TNCV_157731 [Trichonephila clavipes]|nr:hypothetical protein TNCV_157731 [Trichonephila clavipes]
MLQHQGEDPTGPLICSTNPTAVSLRRERTPKRGTTSRLTGAGSLLPPVYSEAWARRNAEVCSLDVKRRKGKNWMTRKMVENREGSLGYPGFVKPVFTKDSKPFGEIEKDH